MSAADPTLPLRTPASTTVSPRPRRLPRRGLAAGVACHFLLASLGIGLSQHGGSVAGAWCANAIGALLLSRTPRFWWPAMLASLAASTLLAGWGAGEAPMVCLALVAGDLPAMAAGAALLARYLQVEAAAGQPQPGPLVRALLLAGGLPALLGATLGAPVLAAVQGTPLQEVWTRWVMGALTAGMAVLPLGVELLTHGTARLRSALASTSGLMPLLGALAVVLAATAYVPRPFAFVAMPLMALALTRGLALTALATSLVAGALGLMAGAGFVAMPATQEADASAWALWLYLPMLGALLPAPLLAAAVDAQRVANARAQAERAQLASLARNVPGVLFRSRTRPDGSVTFDYLSENAASLLGPLPAGFCASDVTAMMRPEEAARYWRERVAASGERAPFSFETRILRSDGRPAWLRVVARHALDDGEDILYDGIFLDTTVEAAQRSRWSVVFETAELATWEWDVPADQVMLDGRLAALLGYPANEPTGSLQALVRRLLPGERDATLARLGELVDGRSSRYRMEHRLHVASGNSRWMLSQATVTEHDADGRAQRVTGTLLDVTELKAAQRAAENASAAKSAFLARMSHELRTPLNGLMGAAHLLMSEPLDEPARALVRLQLEAGQALLATLDDVLDLAKIEAGKLVLESAPFEPGALVQGAVKVLGPLADAKGLTLEVDVDERLAAPRVGDAARLRQVLLNLLGNAVKYTEHGGVRVAARLLPAAGAGAGPQRLRVTVHDSGIGFTAEAAQRLFEPYEQAQAHTAQRFGGTGLGLAISRQLVEAMGGTIGAGSTLGVGSSFWFEVPLPAAPSTEAAGGSSAASEAPSPRALRLLLVEDDALSRLVATRLLERHGHRVSVASDGVEAIEAIDREGFDAVLMDVHMPRMDGLAATRAIRALPDARARLPVIGVTADVVREDLERCLTAGMDMVLTKPIDPARLAATLEAACARQ